MNEHESIRIIKRELERIERTLGNCQEDVRGIRRLIEDSENVSKQIWFDWGEDWPCTGRLTATV